MRLVRWVVPTFLLLIIGLGVAGCKSAYRSTSEVSISGEDIVYLQDQRTKLCFAVLALQNPMGTKIREMKMVSVPCDTLQKVMTL